MKIAYQAEVGKDGVTSIDTVTVRDDGVLEIARWWELKAPVIEAIGVFFRKEAEKRAIRDVICTPMKSAWCRHDMGNQLHQIAYQMDGMNCLTPCPHERCNEWGIIKVNSGACGACRYYWGGVAGVIDCNYHEPSVPCSILKNQSSGT